jgi:NADPH:quinone reductase-like Zn-dependent oxidoreductase
VKAVVRDRYGSPDVLELRDIDKPVVEDDEVLVRVDAASVNSADWHILRGEPFIARLSFGLGKPRDSVLGCDVAGQVEAVGRSVTTIRTGDEVFGSAFGHGFGAFAEFCLFASEDLVEPKPANLTIAQAAAVPLAAMTALQGLRDHGRIEPEQTALIVGASGGVGTFAVQLAKSFGAEVTGVCSTRNVDMVRSIGADHVIDYTKEDVTQGGRRYDLIFQLAGTRSPSELRRALTAMGTLIPISGESSGRWIGPLGRTFKALVMSRLVSQRMASFTMNPNKEDLHSLKERIEAGKVTPVIDRTYALSEVPDAIRYLEKGHARGKVVITTD